MSRNTRYYGKPFPPSDKAVRAECRMWEVLYGHQDQAESQGGAAQGDGDCSGQENPVARLKAAKKIRDKAERKEATFALNARKWKR